MTLLDISDSDYIFKQGKLLFVVGLFICIGILLYATIKLKRALKTEVKSKKKDAYFEFFLWTLLSIAMWYFGFRRSGEESNKLRKNGMETVGETVRKVGRRHDYVEYTFFVKGHKYIDKCGTVYSGKKINGIVCPGGQYVVIYDRNDPTISVMDFKRPKQMTSY